MYTPVAGLTVNGLMASTSPLAMLALLDDPALQWLVAQSFVRRKYAIRDRHIDVLIDMHGLSSGARPGILALRPARSIGTYLGFIGTTALPWIDFVVADRFTLPESLAPFMTERPLYIDGSLIPLSHTPVPRTGLTRA